MSLPFRALLLVYRYLISPLLPHSCRYTPSCSAYALEALERHGFLAGGSLTLRRLVRCHPWGGFGYDPVPTVGQASCNLAGDWRHSMPDVSQKIDRPL